MWATTPSPCLVRTGVEGGASGGHQTLEDQEAQHLMAQQHLVVQQDPEAQRAVDPSDQQMHLWAQEQMEDLTSWVVPPSLAEASIQLAQMGVLGVSLQERVQLLEIGLQRVDLGVWAERKDQRCQDCSSWGAHRPQGVRCQRAAAQNHQGMLVHRMGDWHLGSHLPWGDPQV